MVKLVFNYMRPVAMLLLIFISTAIVISYYFIPALSITALADFYHGYWHLLTLLFFIVFLFLIFAFCNEDAWTPARWWQHIIALGLLGWFAVEVTTLLKVSNILFAFTG